jgi:transcriptional regulator with XRE-family HTH domain
MLEKLLDYLTPDEPQLPNKFTIYMGDKIREARIDAGISQQDLARRVYKRQAALSDYENGKAIVNSDTLSLLAVILNKPLEYFYPHYQYDRIHPGELSPFEDELIKSVRYHIAGEQFMKLLIDIVKAIGKFDTDTFVVENYEGSKALLEHEEEIRSYQEKRKKK